MKQRDYKTLDSLVSGAVVTKRTGALVKALAAGLDPDSPDPESSDRTFLFNYHITPAVAKALLAAGADASYTDANGYQPLHSANPKVAELLLAAGADIEARVPSLNATPLITHAIRGDAKMVKFLLDRGADVLARWNNHTNDVIGAAASSASDPNNMGGRDKIYRLVERHIAEGLLSRRFKLRSLKDLRP
jgi:ankyrin repeat protein